MKSTPTPHTHTGITSRELTIQFGSGGQLQYTVTVPAGTKCKKLDGGSDPWVVQDLSFIDDKKGLLYSDADIYGIRVPEAEIVDVVEVSRSLPRPRFG